MAKSGRKKMGIPHKRELLDQIRKAYAYRESDISGKAKPTTFQLRKADLWLLIDLVENSLVDSVIEQRARAVLALIDEQVGEFLEHPGIVKKPRVSLTVRYWRVVEAALRRFTYVRKKRVRKQSVPRGTPESELTEIELSE